MVLNTRAASVLDSLLQESGDLLPLDCESQELWMFNATRVVDALDEERSSIVRYSTGGIMFVERYVFRPSVVSGLSAFRLPYAPGGTLFVSEEVAEEARGAGLTGTIFEEVWAW